MNYIKQINAFYDWLETNSLSLSAIALWHALMHICNKTGWATEFAVATSVLSIKTGLSDRAIRNARNELKQKGRIDWRPRKGNQSAIYTIIPFPEDLTEIYSDNRSGNHTGNRSDKYLSEINSDNHSGNCSGNHSGNCSGNHSALYKLNETKRNINNNDDDVYIISNSQPKTVNDNDPLVFYQQNVGPLTPFVVDLVNEYRKELPDDLIVEALKLAIKNNARNLRYVEKILLSWLDRGIRSLDDYKRHEAEWENRKAGQETSNGQERKYSTEEIEGAIRYIKKKIKGYEGNNVIEYIHTLGYPDEVVENAIKIMIERGELAV
ncbi:DnaD/phage-associated family protein [Caldicoprobacter guelmensis]|uniref:DnaD domain protein n=1 Tax=Caldicoprobacter guelmensis TaxID=1170224 RepID=UPI001957B0A6|nr:DnaD domain protein [Caldicoprobacter guelmensis]MBM7582976.1 DnaD/phage-associated family protein [Caldicoprobacter guelmensis]